MMQSLRNISIGIPDVLELETYMMGIFSGFSAVSLSMVFSWKYYIFLLFWDCEDFEIYHCFVLGFS